jgi:hypothetical protein
MRTLVQGDYEATSRYERKLDEQGWIGFPRFLGALFFMTVRRRFKDRDQREIIRFVADLRARDNAEGASVDPQATESLIGRVFDPSVRIVVDQTTIGSIQTLVVHRILADENLSPEALDAVLAEAEELAADKS